MFSLSTVDLSKKEPTKSEGTKLKNDWTQQNLVENKITRIQFDVTYKCNERCIHCFCDRDCDEIQITFDKIKPIIDEAYELGLTQIVFSGGECTLIDDFLKIAQYVRSKRIELIVFTNGQKLYNDKEFFEQFVKLYPYSVGLSLYSMNPAIHDKITQVKGSHEKTMAVIKKLSEHKIPVEIKCFLTKYNADYKKKALFSDKLAVKEYIESNIPELKLAKVYQVVDSFEKINFSSLPSSFMIKTNHAWKTNTYIADKNKITPKELKNLRKYYNWVLKLK